MCAWRASCLRRISGDRPVQVRVEPCWAEAFPGCVFFGPQTLRGVLQPPVGVLQSRKKRKAQWRWSSGVIGVSSICPETCERHAGAIVWIQKSSSEDAIRTPSKMDGSALPGAQKGNSTSLKWCQGVGCSGDQGPLADHDGPGPGPGIEPRGIRTLGATHILKLKPRSWADDGPRSIESLQHLADEPGPRDGGA
jgi:hypothetical protein